MRVHTAIHRSGRPPRQVRRVVAYRSDITHPQLKSVLLNVAEYPNLYAISPSGHTVLIRAVCTRVNALDVFLK